MAILNLSQQNKIKLKSDLTKSGENVIIFFLGNMGIILPRRSMGT